MIIIFQNKENKVYTNDWTTTWINAWISSPNWLKKNFWGPNNQAMFTLHRIKFTPTWKLIRYIMDNNGTELEQVVHTHRKSCDTSCRIGWPRGFGELNPSPHSWIFTSVSADSSPRSYIFTFATVETCSHYTKLWLRAYPICNPPLQRSARRSFALLQKSRQNYRSYVWTGALSAMVSMATQKHHASIASFCLLEWRGEKKVLSESRQTFAITAAQTPGLVNLVFSCQTGFFECEHPFTEKPMVITEPAVASTRLLGLGLKLLPMNMPCMLNKDL